MAKKKVPVMTGTGLVNMLTARMQHPPISLWWTKLIKKREDCYELHPHHKGWVLVMPAGATLEQVEAELKVLYSTLDVEDSPEYRGEYAGYELAFEKICNNPETNRFYEMI